MSTKDRLERIIALGKRRYIIYHGVLGWGLMTAALYVCWNWYSKGGLALRDVLVPFVVFPIGGIAFGSLMWSTIMKQQEQAAKKRDP